MAWRVLRSVWPYLLSNIVMTGMIVLAIYSMAPVWLPLLVGIVGLILISIVSFSWFLVGQMWVHSERVEELNDKLASLKHLDEGG